MQKTATRPKKGLLASTARSTFAAAALDHTSEERSLVCGWINGGPCLQSRRFLLAKQTEQLLAVAPRLAQFNRLRLSFAGRKERDATEPTLSKKTIHRTPIRTCSTSEPVCFHPQPKAFFLRSGLVCGPSTWYQGLYARPVLERKRNGFQHRMPFNLTDYFLLQMEGLEQDRSTEILFELLLMERSEEISSRRRK